MFGDGITCALEAAGPFFFPRVDGEVQVNPLQLFSDWTGYWDEPWGC